MRLICAVLLLATVNAYAVAPQFARSTTPEEFLAGEIEGFAVTSRGELRLGPSVRKIATFVDPFVLSQTGDSAGNRYFGTGNGGRVYRLRGTELKVLYTAPEPEIYSLTFWKGSLYVASSPNGKIYKVDPESGKSTDFFDPKQAYIWTLTSLPDDSLLAGTGVEGKLYKINGEGKGTVAFDSADTHVRSVAPWRNGSLLVGGSARGRIYEIDRAGSARALFDSPYSEISKIFFDVKRDIAWAAGVTNVLPSSSPARPQPAKSSTSETGAEKKKESDTVGANVEVSFSFDDPNTTVTSPGSSELYRIDSEGYVETVRKFDREIVYSLGGDSEGALLVSTGPLGRIYEFLDNDISLIATVPEKQVVSFERDGDSQVVTTTNGGAVYVIEKSTGLPAEYRSAIKDMERFSRLGRFRAEGMNLSNRMKFSVRSGNTSTPDATWSAWSPQVSAAEGEGAAPPARYFQWKINVAVPAPDLIIDSVTVSYLNRNVKPSIDSLTVQDPGVVFVSSGFPASGQVVEATNPDENGIFTSLDVARDRDAGKKAFRKGYRTISWKARDENGDALRYAIHFRQKSSQEWLRLRENMEETQLNFDTSQLPDATFELKLTVTDRNDNPDQPLTDIREGVELVVDNSAPLISSALSQAGVDVTITDRLSPITRAEYSVDAEKWIRLTPQDGIADSERETFRLPASLGKRYVVVRAVDQHFNVATQSVPLQ
ncbi:MAG TPA: hypothetical protein VNM92_03695 [Thermoanaerobaculia bacterium]|nr:hypothetical protein [Thermoanaerobaculia bacterium]